MKIIRYFIIGVLIGILVLFHICQLTQIQIVKENNKIIRIHHVNGYHLRTITSAEYVVEMEYPTCKHYINLEGTNSLPRGEFGRYHAKNNSGGLSTEYISGSSAWYWEEKDGGVRVRNFLESDGGIYPYKYHDFTVDNNQPNFQQFILYSPIDKVIFEAFIEPRHNSNFYIVEIGTVEIKNINNHEALAWSCYEELQIEKKRIDLEHELLAHKAEEQAKIRIETIRLAQEKANATKRLEITREVSLEIKAANSAWLVELGEIKVIEKQIQDDLNQRTLDAIESARKLKDEYVAIRTLQLEEAQERTKILNDFYHEALISWQDFEDLANRAWEEIGASESEIEKNKQAIQDVQDNFDKTVSELNQRIEEFIIQNQKE